jgi:hypothetical protein
MNAKDIAKALKCCYQPEVNYSCAGCPYDGKKPDCIESNIEYHAGEIIESLLIQQETLQKALAESQRRERAAVEDLETTESCITCEHDWDCEYSNSNGCSIANYKWRGPQEGEGNEKRK